MGRIRIKGSKLNSKLAAIVSLRSPGNTSLHQDLLIVLMEATHQLLADFRKVTGRHRHSATTQVSTLTLKGRDTSRLGADVHKSGDGNPANFRGAAIFGRLHDVFHSLRKTER